MNRCFKAIRSLAKLFGLTLARVRQVVGAALRGDREAAGEYTRGMVLAWLNDVSQALVKFQAVSGWRRLDSRRVDRILVIKLDRIGDMVNTLPAFDALREKYPGAAIDVVGHPLPLQLLAGDGRINERIAYRSWLYHPLPIHPPGLKTLMLVARLLWRRYPLVVCLRGSFSFLPLALVSRFAASKFVEAEPVIRRYLRAIEAVTGPVSDGYPKLTIDADDAAWARQFWARLGESQARVTIHAAVSEGARSWPAERFAAVADELHRRSGAVVCFLGAPADEPVLRRIGGLARYDHVYRTDLKLQQSVAVISQSGVLIGNDSGLAHIAAAVETPAVVLWGSPNLSMSRPRAKPGTCAVLYHDVPCRGACREFRCHNPNGMECLTRTAVDDVVQAAQQMLRSVTERERELCVQPA